MAQPVDVDTLELMKRNLLCTQMLALDGTTNIAEDIGRQMIHYGRHVHLSEYAERLAAVTPADIMRVARAYFLDARPTFSVAGPSACLTSFDSAELVQRTAEQRF
jgi:predicted Zn-dependent peptidase